MCRSHRCSGQKRLNRSRCRLGADSCGSKNHVLDWGKDRTNPFANTSGDKLFDQPVSRRWSWMMHILHFRLSINGSTASCILLPSYVRSSFTVSINLFLCLLLFLRFPLIFVCKAVSGNLSVFIRSTCSNQPAQSLFTSSFH